MSTTVPNTLKKCLRCGYDQNPLSASHCEICNHPLSESGHNGWKKTLFIVLIPWVLAGAWWFYNKGERQAPDIPPPTPTPTSTPTVKMSVGILTNSENYKELADYLQKELGQNYQISVDGNSEMSYQEAKIKIVNKEWHIAFTLSPMLSALAKDNGYTYAGVRMFPDYEPYYESALFVRADSPINALSDLGANTILALGDFNSASSFYMPLYDLYSNLYGKKIRMNMGNRSKKIQEMVKNGEADVGAVAYSTIKDNQQFKVIHVSRKIPGSGVYLSPNLTEMQRMTIQKALVNAPEEIKKAANFGVSPEVDYTEFIKISRRVEELLGCSDFSQSTIVLLCSGSTPSPSVNVTLQGMVNGFSLIDRKTVVFYVMADNKQYQLVVERSLINQGDFPPPPGWQDKVVFVRNVQPDPSLRLKITSPEQITLRDKPQ